MESETDTDTDIETETDERYGAIETADGDVVIYDRQQEAAWLQSDTTEDLRA